jgi:hypothetical protein
LNKKNNSIGETSATNVTPPENTGNTSGGSSGGGGENLFRELVEYFENEYGNESYVPLKSNTM